MSEFNQSLIPALLSKHVFQNWPKYGKNDQKLNILISRK